MRRGELASIVPKKCLIGLLKKRKWISPRVNSRYTEVRDEIRKGPTAALEKYVLQP